MGYRPTTFEGLSCSLTTRTPDGDCVEHGLEVMFSGYSGYDVEAYGSTTCRRYGGSVEEATEYFLDDEPITLERLEKRFGVKHVAAAIQQAANDAEEVI